MHTRWAVLQLPLFLWSLAKSCFHPTVNPLSMHGLFPNSPWVWMKFLALSCHWGFLQKSLRNNPRRARAAAADWLLLSRGHGRDEPLYPLLRLGEAAGSKGGDYGRGSLSMWTALEGVPNSGARKCFSCLRPRSANLWACSYPRLKIFWASWQEKCWFTTISSQNILSFGLKMTALMTNHVQFEIQG